MSETGKREQPRARKSYAKPVVRRVHLKPEEAVLAGCKTSSISGPSPPQCDKKTCLALTS
jgi:hypothetical protein